MVEPTMITCPRTGWLVQPIDVQEPVKIGATWYAWWHCPLCDCDGHTRRDPDYSPARPAPHVIALTNYTPPPEWCSRYEEVPNV